MLYAFGAAIVLSAGLLFMVQPLVAKILLPRLGGSPAVWNTCMVFFQLLLLVGYGYSHLLTRKLKPRASAVVHCGMILLPLIALSVSGLAPPANWIPPESGSPIPWLLGSLALTCGLPFFALATTGPLLQRWFSWTPHPRRHDPYFLYAASNTGSVVALLAYPFCVEWLLTLSHQQALWTWGYGGFVALTAGCAAVLLRSPPPAEAAPAAVVEVPAETAPPTPAPSVRTRLRWVALAAVPSSLVLGATQYLSTDIAAIPLLWVVPLVLYLLSFVAAFSERFPLSLHALTRCWVVMIVPVALSLLIDARDPILAVIVIHLLGLFVAGLLCHRQLAVERPGPRHLTGFYLLLALGGALGGSFNALLGPVLFNTVLEYPLALAAACFLVPFPPLAPELAGQPWWRRRWPELVVPLAAVLCFVLFDHLLEALGVRGGRLARLLCLGTPLVVVYLASSRPLAFALGITAMLAVAQTHPGEAELPYHFLARNLEVCRTFFGVHRVCEGRDGNTVALLDGSTMHGLERRDMPGVPLLYYHRGGPAGDLLRRLEGDPRLQRVGVIGLGCGALAAYSQPGQRWTFYEIDPQVVRLARTYFTFLPRAGDRVQVELGDGRLSLQRKVAPGELGLLVLDAFSSDAIPTHLLTREAFELYFDRLGPRGLLVLHVSNRYLSLGPIVARLAQELGLTGQSWLDNVGYEEDSEKVAQGLQASHWIVVARRAQDLPPYGTPRWRPLAAPPGTPLWTDDYTNLFSVLGKDD